MHKSKFVDFLQFKRWFYTQKMKSIAEFLDFFTRTKFSCDILKIGNNCAIGANAVVMCDVPDNCVAVGIPAVVKQRKTDN